MGWVIVTSQKDYAKACALAKGSYQQGLLDGRENLSGSTLRGKAKQYGGRYAQSRLPSSCVTPSKEEARPGTPEGVLRASVSFLPIVRSGAPIRREQAAHSTARRFRWAWGLGLCGGS